MVGCKELVTSLKRASTRMPRSIRESKLVRCFSPSRVTPSKRSSVRMPRTVRSLPVACTVVVGVWGIGGISMSVLV